MDKTRLNELRDILDATVKGLPGVTAKRVFGCHAVFRKDAMFGMVWKTGRIAVKLTDPISYATLMALEGAEPWVAHTKMAHWVLLPPGAETSASLLSDWVGRAYNLAESAAGQRGARKGKPAG